MKILQNCRGLNRNYIDQHFMIVGSTPSAGGIKVNKMLFLNHPRLNEYEKYTPLSFKWNWTECCSVQSSAILKNYEYAGGCEVFFKVSEVK